jgi:hypothetical protein
LFTWTPTEAQGPSTNQITVRVTDNGASPLSATASFPGDRHRSEHAADAAAMPNQTINEGSPLKLESRRQRS